MRLFLTGNPGVGKTTLIRAAVARLGHIQCAGFYTEEKRHQGRRIAFRIITLDGQEGTLAALGREPPTVGRYHVYVAEFERLALAQISPDIAAADLYVIDEVGKMELMSFAFRSAIVDLLARPTNMLATIAKRGKGFLEQIKCRNDVELLEVTRENRDRLAREIADRISRELAPQPV